MSTSASSTLTAAMMPSSRFVVSRFPAVISPPPSVRRRRSAERGGLRARGVEFIYGANAVVGHFPKPFNRLLKAREFGAQFLDCRLEAFAHALAAFGKEEVTRGRANCRADDCPQRNRTRLVHKPLLRMAQRYAASKTNAIS